MSASNDRIFGQYQLLEEIGEGGMGVVYRAERVGEAGFRKAVALKRMSRKYRQSPELIERFAAEARTNARLSHPNLVQVIEFDVEPEPYLVMELIEGVTLLSLLRRLHELGRPLDPSEAAFIAAEAAQGLDHAHHVKDDRNIPLGIIHRDVSPQNILISKDGVVKVSDFGLVKAADNLTDTGGQIPVGKFTHMAPEQAAGHPLDARADIFALGIVLWEMLTMSALMPTDDPPKTLQLLQTCTFRPPSNYNADVPASLDQLCLQCLQRDREQRPPSALSVASELRTIAHRLAPGYDRLQLAQLVCFAFPERGWEGRDPNRPPPQPTPQERASLPPVERATAVVQRKQGERTARAITNWTIAIVVLSVLGVSCLASALLITWFMYK